VPVAGLKKETCKSTVTTRCIPFSFAETKFDMATSANEEMTTFFFFYFTVRYTNYNDPFASYSPSLFKKW